MKAFVETLKEIRDGELTGELSAKLQELVAAVTETEKQGALTIKLTLKHTKKAGILLLEDDIKLVLPEPDRDTSTVFFATDENDLTRRDPRQPSLPGVRGVVASMTPPSERTAENG